MQAIFKHRGPLSPVIDPPSCAFYCFSNPSSLPQALFLYLVKAVEYKTVSVQSLTAVRGWMADLDLKSQISEELCPQELYYGLLQCHFFHSVVHAR